MKTSKKILTIIIGVLLLDVGVGMINYYEGGADDQDLSLRVVVTIPPQEEFVEEVGGDKIKITLMVPPGQDPHSYEPKSSQMRELAKADIYYKVGSGIEFEKTWMETFKDYNPNMKVIDGSKGIELQEMDGDSHSNDDHEEGMDPHIWMSPKNTINMIENLLSGIIEEDPENEGFYRSNAEGYISRLNSLHDDIKNKLIEYEGNKFMVYHPSFGYFADEYNLTQVPIEEEGKEPGTKGLQSIIDQAREEDISVLFVSPQFDKSNAETIADEIDGEVISLNPLAEDYIGNMEEMLEKLVNGFEKGRDYYE